MIRPGSSETELPSSNDSSAWSSAALPAIRTAEQHVANSDVRHDYLPFQKTRNISNNAAATQLALVYHCIYYCPGHTTSHSDTKKDAAGSFRDAIEWSPACIWESELQEPLRT